MAASGNYGGGMKGGPNAGGNAGPMGGNASGGFGGADRPGRGPSTGTTVPNYGGWPSIGDLGIMGAITNMIGGIYNGNTYAGRTPTGFTQSSQRDMGAMGGTGNTGGGWAGANYGGANLMGQPYGMRQKVLGLLPQNLAAAQAAAAQPKARDLVPTQGPRPMNFAPQMFMSPGGSQNYGVMRPGYNFFGPGSI